MPIENRDIQCIYISFIYEHNRMCIMKNSRMLIDMKCSTTDRYCQSKPGMNEAGITNTRVATLSEMSGTRSPSVTRKDPIKNRPKGFKNLSIPVSLRKLLFIIGEYNDNTSEKSGSLIQKNVLFLIFCLSFSSSSPLRTTNAFFHVNMFT